VKNVKSN